MIDIGFQRTNDNSSLYVKEGSNKTIMLVEIFVCDIVFIGNDDLCKAFLEEMIRELEMSMFGEIKFFVGLEIKQRKKWYLHHSIQIYQGNIKEV